MWCRGVTILLLIFAIGTGSGESADMVLDQPAVRSALGAEFAEAHVADAAWDVLQQAKQLEEQERFEFLARWVLPNEDHATLRMQAAFSPTRLAAHDGTTETDDGGKVVAPVLELMKLAKELGKLATVRHQVASLSPDTTDQQISRLAGLVLASAADNDVAGAKSSLSDLYKIVAGYDSVKSEWRSPLLVAIEAGIGQNSRECVASARDIAYDIVETQQAFVHTHAWSPFERHAMALAERASMAAHRMGADQLVTNPVMPFTQWHSATLATAKSQGRGCPPSIWWRTADGIAKTSGHQADYLYYQSPLRGDFEIEFDGSALSWRNLQIAVGGHWAGAALDLKQYSAGILRDFMPKRIDLPTPLTKVRSKLHYRMVVRDGTATFYADGHLLQSIKLETEHDPWLALGRFGRNSVTARDVRITGRPVIPDSICLSKSSELTGWISYHGESVGGLPKQRRRWRQDDEDGGTGIISSSRKSDLEPGIDAESLLYYHRPMLEDGTIEYEFLYQQGKRHTHPALGRTVFLLKPEGVALHTATDGIYDRTDKSPGNERVDKGDQQHSGTLPLLEDVWNFVQLRLSGDTVNLYLNDKHIYEHQVSPANSRNFGLFHFCDRERAYAHNVVWEGDWPKTLPRVRDQELASRDTEFLDLSRSTLPETFTHTFDDRFVPENEFQMFTGAPGDFRPDAEGMCLAVESTSGYANTGLEASLGASGDFDINVTYSDFVANTGDGGTCNAILQVVLENEQSSECNLRRRHNRFIGRSDEQQLVYTDVLDRTEKGDERFQLGNVPMARNSGTLRIARRGDRIYTLCAEADSPNFRITAEGRFPTDDIRVGGIRLRVLSNKKSSTSVRFHKLTVQAEKLFGTALIKEPPQELVAKLDSERKRLPNMTTFDFTEAPYSPDEFVTGTGVRPWRSDDGGVLMHHVGEERWRGSLMALRRRLEGDFDITATFELKEITNPEQGKESCIYLKLNYSDADRTMTEVLFRESSQGVRDVEARVGRPSIRGKFVYERLRGVYCKNAVSVRIARYGTTAYYLTRAAPDAPEILIATLKVTDAPISGGRTMFMVHSGGVGRETLALFKTLKIHGGVGNRVVPHPDDE